MWLRHSCLVKSLIKYSIYHLNSQVQTFVCDAYLAKLKFKLDSSETMFYKQTMIYTFQMQDYGRLKNTDTTCKTKPNQKVDVQNVSQLSY